MPKGKGHRKGKSMDLEMIAQGAPGSRKIIINSNFIHEMRKRSANSEMKQYPHPPKKKKSSEGGKKS